MRFNRAILPCSMRLLVFSFFLVVNGLTNIAFTQDEPSDLTYPVVEGDNLWNLSTQYYGSPKVFPVLYQYNKAVLDSAWASSSRIDSSLSSKYPDKRDFLAPGIHVLLPFRVELNGFLYERGSRIESWIMDRLGHNITIKNLLETAIDSIGPVDVLDPPVREPFQLFEQVSTESQLVANRENPPTWYDAPQTAFQRCARLIGMHYKQLNYVECLIIAKRLYDAYGGRTNRMLNKCENLPKTLPLEIDISLRVPKTTGVIK